MTQLVWTQYGEDMSTADIPHARGVFGTDPRPDGIALSVTLVVRGFKDQADAHALAQAIEDILDPSDPTPPTRRPVADEARRRDGKWKRVADILAERMIYRDSCDNGHATLTEDCPFCDDIAAMVEYRKAGGKVGLPLATGKPIDVSELTTKGTTND